ncbi:MAG: ATP phosphoribosyltransferase regulatory subunit [Thauera sp.]|jgi:ATP phosphoribosyltransferase regulatory subunit|nr:ATP phosphoribosyltransferase regulatory subunit [Thauera sp.]
MRWVLPDHIRDALPAEAHQIENLRRRLLDAFFVHGYQLVMPPLLEYIDGLATGAGQDLQLRTFQLVDQLSGRIMGVRADMTPQVTRIDAHLLNRQGVSRLCYCANALHTLPATLTATREPLQLGAELYGHAGLEADVEILRLLAEVLRLAEVPASRIDIGHVGLFRVLARDAGLAGRDEQTLFELLQTKDLPSLRELLAGVAEPQRSALLALPDLYGGTEVIERAAAVLPQTDQIGALLAELRQLVHSLADLPISFDLSDVRGYHYHSGIVFAAYGAASPAALARGGRFDHVGEAFGRARPATGFSLDLRELVWHLPDQDLPADGVLAPWSEDAELIAAVAALRAQGVVVMRALPGHEGSWKEAGCNRQLVKRDGRWQVVALEEA